MIVGDSENEISHINDTEAKIAWLENSVATEFFTHMQSHSSFVTQIFIDVDPGLP